MLYKLKVISKVESGNEINFAAQIYIAHFMTYFGAELWNTSNSRFRMPHQLAISDGSIFPVTDYDCRNVYSFELFWIFDELLLFPQNFTQKLAFLSMISIQHEYSWKLFSSSFMRSSKEKLMGFKEMFIVFLSWNEKKI